MNSVIAKKLFAGVAAVSMLLVAAPVFAAAHAEGTNVNKAGTIGMIIGGQFRPYTSAGAFLSYGFNSWSTVVEANADDSALPVGSFIPPQDGSIIFSDRGADKGTGYVISGGSKYGFPTEAIFKGQGYSYANAMWADVSWMPMGGVINSADAAHLPGTLVNNAGTVQLVGNTGLMGVPDLATFNSWGYSFAKVVPANANDKAKTQTGVMATRQAGQLSPVSMGTNPGQTGPVTAMLASDNPASNTVVTTQAAADLAHFTFTGNGVVTAVTLKRTGISADASLSNVYLFDGSTRLTDAASVSAGSQINFSNAAGLFTVSGSKTVSVRADLAASAGETIGVQLTSFTAGGTTSTVSISGNLFSVASATVAGITFAAATPSTATIDPAKDVVVWQSTATVATRDVWLDRVAFREIGSINYSDINNLRLQIDGTTVATVANLDSNGYVTFIPSSPVKLMTGSRIFKVLADVIGGSTRTATFSIRQKADLGVRDSQYNVGISTGTATPIAAGTLTISTGSLTVQKTSDSASTDVTLNGTDVSLAKYTLTAYGEPVKIETLAVRAIMGTNGTAATTIRNGRLLFNGQQYGSTTNVSTAATTSFTTNFTVNPGSPVTLEVRGDIVDGDGTTLAADDTIQIRIGTGTNNGQGLVSGTTVNVPAANSDANTVTVKSGSIALAKTANYTNQATTLPQTAYKLASYQLTGSSVEDVNINTISVDFTSVTNATFSSADLSNVYVVYGGQRESVTKSSVSATGNTWSVSRSLAKNAVVQVDIFADLGSTVTAGDSIKATTTISGTTAQSGQSINTGAVDSQTIAYGAASITSSVDASTPVAANLDDGSTTTAAAFRFDAVNDAQTITEVVVKFGAAPTTVGNVVLKDGATVVATKPGAASVTFGGLSIPVAANGYKVLTVDVQLSPVGISAGTSGENVAVTLDSFKATSSTGTTTSNGTDRAGNAMYVYKALPTVSVVTLPNTLLSTGTQVLGKFTVNTNGTGTIGWKKITFTVTKTTAPGLASFALYDADSNTQVAGAFTPTGTFTAAGGTGGTQAFVATNEQQVSGAKTYELRATVSGTITAGESVTTSIASGVNSYTAPAAYATVAGTAATFVWTDVSASSHSTTTTDWSDDYLIKNIPTNSQSLSR